MWVHGRTHERVLVSSVPPWFRANSGMNLIEQRKNVKGGLSGSVAQLVESSHGMREAGPRFFLLL